MVFSSKSSTESATSGTDQIPAISQIIQCLQGIEKSTWQRMTRGTNGPGSLNARSLPPNISENTEDVWSLESRLGIHSRFTLLSQEARSDVLSSWNRLLKSIASGLPAKTQGDNDDNQDNQDNKDQNEDQKDQDGEGDDKESDDGKPKDQDDQGDEKKDQGDENKDDKGKPEDKDGDQKDQGKDGDKEKEQQQPKPGQGQLSPQQVKSLLEAMKNEENKVQDKINAQKVKGAKVKTDKDW